MPYLTSDGWMSVGHRVQVRGRYNKWFDMGLYCSREAAQFFIDKCTSGPAEKYRILEEAC
jgi:hypothetical protein